MEAIVHKGFKDKWDGGTPKSGYRGRGGEFHALLNASLLVPPLLLYP